jgi:PhnB protein
MAMFSAYLTFDGHCVEAMKFYADTLGGQLEVFRMGDSPMAGDLPASHHDRAMHATLTLDGAALMAADTMPGQPFQPMQGVSITLAYRDVEQGRRVFDAMSAGGQVTMPYQKTFWSPGFGMFADRYGVSWMVNVDA